MMDCSCLGLQRSITSWITQQPYGLRELGMSSVMSSSAMKEHWSNGVLLSTRCGPNSESRRVSSKERSPAPGEGGKGAVRLYWAGGEGGSRQTWMTWLPNASRESRLMLPRSDCQTKCCDRPR